MTSLNVLKKKTQIRRGGGNEYLHDFRIWNIDKRRQEKTRHHKQDAEHKTGILPTQD